MNPSSTTSPLKTAQLDPIKTLIEYVRFKSISTDPSCKDELNKAADFLVKLFEGMGLNAKKVKTPLHSVILAKREGKPEWPHVVIYGHYDVQPVDPLNEWHHDPFDPVMKGTKMFARGSSDNKGQLMTHLMAVAQLLEEEPNLPLRITFIVEGEEEMGSPSFPGFLAAHKDELKADVLILSDTESDSPEQIVINTALRGIIGMEIELKGPNIDVHSGLYGGAVVNPIYALTQLCASFHGPNGRVNIPGFYDDVIEPAQWERDEIKKSPNGEVEIKKALQIDDFFHQEGMTPLEGVSFYPTLEFNGIQGGYQGLGVKTVLPSKALVKLTMRLVPGQKPEKIVTLVKDAIMKRCPKGVKPTIIMRDEGAPAYVVIPPHKSNSPKDMKPILAKAFDAVEAAIVENFGKKPLYIRGGGSIPIMSQIKSVLDLDCIMIGLGLPEDAVHSPNENFDVRMMQKGILMSKSILRKIAQ